MIIKQNLSLLQLLPYNNKSIVMFEKLVEKILNPILSEYLEDFNAENMKIGLWSGEVVIKNVKLKKEVIKKLNLPFKIKYSRLGCLKMSIPWKSLTSSKIDIVVEGFQLIIAEVPQNQWQCKNHKIIEQRKQQIVSYCESIVGDFAKKAQNANKEDEEKGFLGSMVTKIIDNIQVTIKDIHVRYEDDLTRKYSFGFTLEQLKIYTVNKKGEPEFIDRTKKQYEFEPLRKKMLLSNFGFYWNERSTFFNEPEPYVGMLATIARANQKTDSSMNYLILMSSHAELYQREAGKQYIEPQINVVINFEELKVKISNEQLQQIIILSERLQSYMSEVKAQNRKKLTQDQMLQNHKEFVRIFPSFFDKSISVQDQGKLEDMLQKMEVDNFRPAIKNYLQSKQKEKMVQDKINKNKGWFSRPKELTEAEMQEIEAFIKDNFGHEISVIKRPPQFYYIRVNFGLKLLNVSVANTNYIKKWEQGISLSLESINMGFGLREGGYQLDFGMNNIRVDLYDKSTEESTPASVTTILQKMPQEKVTRTVGQYVKLQVYGNPIEQKHLDTQIMLNTEQILIEFDPKILKIAQDFASSIKISSGNTEAAIEAYGDIKNKITTAASQAASSISKTEKKKNFISLDVSIKEVNFILFFDPLRKDGDLWALNLGQANIYSDPEVLKRPEFAPDEAMEKYCMKTSKMSMIHFASRSRFFQAKIGQVEIDPRQKIMSELSVDFQVQIFKSATEQIPKIRAKSVIHTLDVNISHITYPALQQIGSCFALPAEIEIQEKKQVQKQKANEKSQVMKQSKKIGIVYEQSKEPTKYIAVLSGSYIYLYVDKKDVQYKTYYYVKNSKTAVSPQPDPAKKPLVLTIENSVNKLVLGFEKEASMNQWINVIKSLDERNEFLLQEPVEQAPKEAQSPGKKPQPADPNTLNFEVNASVEIIRINSIINAKDSVSIEIRSLGALARIHESKIAAKVTLQSIQIHDNIYAYKQKQLSMFLYSTSIQGKQQLIDINFEQLAEQHPKYQCVDARIDVEVGGLVCNYKPQTVQSLMLFFLPPAQSTGGSTIRGSSSSIGGSSIGGMQKKESEVLHQEEVSPSEIKKRKIDKINQEIRTNKKQRFVIRLDLKVEQIALAMINRKSRTMIAQVGLNKMTVSFGQSSRRMLVGGAISQLWMKDYSRYPETIIEEQSEYTAFHYLVQSYSKTRDMVTYNIQLLEAPNPAGKTMLIRSQLSDLKFSYVQQPVLRLISYLLEQMLPSLTPSSTAPKPTEFVVKDSKPEDPGMEIVLELENVLAVVEPRNVWQECLELLVRRIVVKNNSIRRPFIKNPASEQQKVLVENYDIKLAGISIIAKYNHLKSRLTNDLSIDLSCDLVQNTAYYDKTFGARYEPGMRVQCKMSPFLLKLGHDDFNFIMKCLFWNISYDDNAEGYLYDGQMAKQQRKQAKTTNKYEQEPMYIELFMDRIVMCVVEDNFPLAVLLLGGLTANMDMNPNQMSIDFKMSTLYGTNVKKSAEEDVSIERGMFNAFGVERRLKTSDLYDIDKLVDIYSVASIQKELALGSDKPVISMFMEMTNESEIYINLQIEGLKVAIDLNSLLALSKLAIMEPNIQPPKSTLAPAFIKQQEQASANAGRMKISMNINNFLGCLSDSTGNNYIVMEGGFLVNLNMSAAKKEEEVAELGKGVANGQFLDAAFHEVWMMNYCVYFCNVKQLNNKRYILLPLNLNITLQQFYAKTDGIVFLQTNADGFLEKIIVECSVRDMLMINKIAQDNLQALNSYNNKLELKNKESQQQSRDSMASTVSNLIASEIEIDVKKVEQTKKKVEKKIKDRMKANMKLEPMQIRIINDCDNNFMPVINYLTQESTLLVSSDAIKTHCALELTMKLDFFNPRSSNWQPIIETFQISIDFLSLASEFGSKNKIILSSSQIEELKELKINLSTQLVTILLATLEIAKSEKKRIEQAKSVAEVEVSPYIIENITNSKITIERFGTEIEIEPLFKGPLKLTDKAESLTFTCHKKKYSVGLDRFGQIRVPGLDDIHLNFKMEKLSRVISFIGSATIKNATINPIYCVRYDNNKKQLEPYLLIEPGATVPVEKNWWVKFSFNMKTFTILTKASELSKTEYLKSESEKFKLVANEQRVILGHTIYYIRSPFIILNCLPKDMELQFFSNGRQVASKKIAAQSSHEVFANEDIHSLRYKLTCEGFYWSQEFGIETQLPGRDNMLFLGDREKGGSCIKYIFERDEHKMQFRLNIFCPAFIVSQLDYDVNIYANLSRDEVNQSMEKYYKLGGQSEFWRKQSQEEKRDIDKITLVGAESGNKIRVCGKDCLIDFSEPIPIKNIGVSQTRIVVEKKVDGKNVAVFTVLGVEVELKKMSLQADIYSRQITLRSRWIFSNNTNYKLGVKEDGSDRFYYIIDKNQKKPFYFIVPELKIKPKKLIFKTETSSESVPILANGLGSVYFKVNEQGKTIYFKLNISQVQSYLYYSISEVEYKDLPYQVVVRSSRLQGYVELYQKQVTKNGEPVLFINEIPHQPFKLKLFVRPSGGSKHQEFYVQADNLNYKQKMRFFEEGVTETFIMGVVYVLFNDSKKYIVIDEIHKGEEFQLPEYEMNTVNFKLEKLSISIIQNHTQLEKPFESFYFYMSNLEFILEQTNKKTRMQAKLQFMQLDQDQPFNIAQPVIITPIKYKQYTSTDPKDKPKAIFNSLIEIDNSFVKNLFINQMIIDINDMVVNVASPFIKLILQIVKQYTDAAKAEEEYLIKRDRVNTWEKISPPQEGSKTFIKSLRIAPFTVSISAQIRLNELDNDSVVLFGTIINALGVVITNIDEAPIVFDGIALDDCVDTLDGINSKLMEHYKTSVIRQFYKIFGSLNIIGNPVSLFRNISTGFKDLKEKPSEGFVEGPLEFGKGLAQGTSSLIAHSFGGALNSVEKVTGTLATGLAALTFDKEFEEKRQRQKMKKPKHVIQGLEKGGKAVFHGFKQGITGLFLKPIEKTQKQGVVGFFKGVGQGVAGLVVKPVTGVVDFASKTTQGLKNTALYMEDRPNQNRIRYPRVLYTSTGMVKQYNAVDSKLMAILLKAKDDKKKAADDEISYYMDSFQINERTFLVVLNDSVGLVHIEEQKIICNASLSSLRTTRKQPKVVLVEGSPKNQGFWEKGMKQYVTFETNTDADRFQKLIEDLRSNMGIF